MKPARRDQLILPSFRRELLRDEHGNLVARAPSLTQWIYAAAIGGGMTLAIGEAFIAADLDSGVPWVLFAASLPATMLARLSLGRFNRELVIKAGSQLVMLGSSVAARFTDIECVELQRQRNDEEYWQIWLRMRNGRRIHVASAKDETTASMDAAEIGRTVGQDVRLA